jgi:hypothetical protein
MRRNNTDRLNLVRGAVPGREHASRGQGRHLSDDLVEPLGSVCVYLCALLTVIFMWDTSLTHNPAERP